MDCEGRINGLFSIVGRTIAETDNIMSVTRRAQNANSNRGKQRNVVNIKRLNV
jgi:hypothetical protein